MKHFGCNSKYRAVEGAEYRKYSRESGKQTHLTVRTWCIETIYRISDIKEVYDNMNENEINAQSADKGFA